MRGGERYTYDVEIEMAVRRDRGASDLYEMDDSARRRHGYQEFSATDDMLPRSLAGELLRSILGPTRSDIRPLAFAIAVAEELLFNQGLAMDDVQITKQIYPMVARQFRKTDNAAAKCVERLSRLCWEAMVAQDLVAQYLGRAIQQSPTPRSLIVYLAVYSHTGSPFYTVIEEDPYFLFQLPESVQSSSSADSTSDEPHTPRETALSVCPCCGARVELQNIDSGSERPAAESDDGAS